MSEKQIFKYLVIALGTAAVIILAMEIYLKTSAAPPPEIQLPPLKEVKVDFSIFDNFELKGLLPFQVMTAPEEDIGRENPFLPYWE